MFLRKLLFFVFLGVSAFAQLDTPTTWSTKVSPENPKVGDVVSIEFTAKIQKNWKIYAANMDPNIGPIVTEFNFKKSADFEPIGKIIQAKAPKKVYEDIWESDVLIYKESAKFIQKVKILKENPSITGKISYQSCTDVDGRCINGDEKINVAIKTSAASQAEESKIAPETIATTEEIASVTEDGTETKIDSVSVTSQTLLENSQSEVTSTPTEPQSGSTEDLWKFLLAAFGVGFASIFMPCIYPIMPMTVSFFTKQEKGKSKAVFYGVSIMFIFGLMGLVTMSLGAPFLNFLSTHWIPNLIFFVIFILFGISLLGGFEIILPHNAVNKIDRMSDRGGFIGIFFMALTLVVVSFSCTVPLVGTLLIAAAQGEVLRPLYGMLAFGLPFALVFSGLAMFPQILKTLPKSGGWLNELKAVFGFLEFALALKFLSNIDLVYHWNLIHRNVFLVIWILVAFLIGIYILGYLRMPKDDKITKRGGLRISFAVLFFALAAYMLPGVTGKSLSLLSGILPPMPVAASSAAPESDKMRALPHGLFGFYDFDDAKEHAAKVGKPILIDFTGYACANCRKMEENVWPKPEVLERLKNDFVIASLYVDDKKELPKEKQFVSTYDQELKTTVGEKNMDLEITKYNNNAQPYYIIVNANGETIVNPLGYSTVEDFVIFLDKAKAAKK